MTAPTDLTNKYALAALRERRAEMAGEIVTLERRLRYLRDAAVNLDGSIKVFDPTYESENTLTKLPRRRTNLFGAGGLNRMILDALRTAGKPMTTAEVIDAVTIAAGFGDDSKAGMGLARAAGSGIWPGCAGWS